MDGDSIELRDLAIGDSGWIISRHGTLYAQEEGYDATFVALVAEILAAYIRTRIPARERAWIAVHGKERLGCIFCVTTDADTANCGCSWSSP